MTFSAKAEALLRSLFAIDENGNTYIRVTGSDFEPGELKNAVSTQSARTVETLLANAIVLDADGNPALRLASVPFGKTVGEAEKERREKARREAAQVKERREAAAKKAAAERADKLAAESTEPEE